MSHQAEFGYPEWGDKPTMQFPKGVQIGTLHGDVASNTVVMWTDKAKDEAEKDEQATIRFTPHPISQHLPSHFK